MPQLNHVTLLSDRLMASLDKWEPLHRAIEEMNHDEFAADNALLAQSYKGE